MIATENEWRTARNADRARRRAGGEDELLLDEDGSERPGATSDGTTLPPPSPPSLADKDQFAGALQGLSPSRQSIILKVFESLAGKAHTTTHTIGGTSTETNATGERSLSAAFERSSDQFQYQSLEIPPAIVKLGLARVHIPLTLLTPSAIRKIHQYPTSVKTKKVLTYAGQKLDLLDLSAWPDESSLPPERFFEAWQNMLKIYARIGDDTVTNRFQTHFGYILALPDFAEDYKAILRFDCEVRRRYMNNPARFSPADSSYQNRLNAIKSRVLSEEIKAGRQSQSDFSLRFSPYPQGGRCDNRAMRAGGSRPHSRPASYA
ncbi:uncharacterized protein LAESUDRAFT_757172 [Laetiporus sulphureus 93-53]|uniref:Uncharacterized protein n=1 Tax=Laetiporus sulphureus 93-53 TaxID=1314785 RepID=A0A165FHQ4_9APHY|nr:uncharacterized protein LAESUDRAFT_757172 [Laetiporus sulphureus 93-53]KZT08988.1 hypothetical protein LAESUDRAFT_757172 [Laetiporus sulphureus 93-53]